MNQLLSTDIIGTLASDLDRGISLPASWYTDPAILALENERIFRRSWQYIGRADQLARPGDYVTGEAGNVPVVVVRSEQGLRGFVNVCRHRRHLVMAGAGNRKMMQCPYHAWSYDLDGNLKAAPRADREECLNLADWPLLPIRVDSWGPFVFVNADDQAPPMTHFFGDLPDIIAGNGLDLAGLKFHQREEWRAAANWKVTLENYLECYHCPVAHPGFSSVINVHPDAYLLQPSEWFFTQVAPVRTETDYAAYDPRGAIVKAQYYYLWPNITLSTNPGHPNLVVHTWLPDGPEQTRGVVERYFGPDAPAEFIEQMSEFSRQVGIEDQALTTSVQRGLRCGLPEQGRLLHKSEQLVLRFQKKILNALSRESPVRQAQIS